MPSKTHRDSGNVMVYILIVVALFAALSFLLSRQTDLSETSGLGTERANIMASQILQTPMEMKQSLDQILWTGVAAADLDLSQSGGDVMLPRLSADAIDEENIDPPPGWYIGRFNNIEWTASDEDDVVATAHQISQQICALINRRLTGSSDIPELSSRVNELLIDESHSSAAGNINFTSAHCPACFGQPALCVQDNGRDAWSFYSVLISE